MHGVRRVARSTARVAGRCAERRAPPELVDFSDVGTMHGGRVARSTARVTGASQEKRAPPELGD